MKANELRIGNLVKCLGEERELIGITKHNGSNETALHYAEFKGVIPIKLFHLKPIPLTEEWLLKFGFNDATGGWGGSQGSERFYEKGIVEIQTYDSDDKWHLKGQFEVKFKYVHQLQNLYFALCGEELEIN